MQPFLCSEVDCDFYFQKNVVYMGYLFIDLSYINRKTYYRNIHFFDIMEIKRLLMPLVFVLVCSCSAFAQSDYYQKRAESYTYEAEYYQKRAKSYRREADYYFKKAEGYKREISYYTRRGDMDRVKTYTRYYDNAMDKYETQLRYANNAEEKARDYLRKAANALDR